MKIAFFARASHAHAIPPLPIGGLGGLSGYIKVFIAIYDLCTFADGAVAERVAERVAGRAGGTGGTGDTGGVEGVGK